MKLIITMYQSSDNDGIKKLYELASIHSEIGYRSGPWEHDFDDIETYYLKDGHFLVGKIGNQYIAMVGCQRISNSIGQVRRLRVHPNFRRKGIAQKMIDVLENEAKKQGMTELRLRTSTQQLMAQQFYEKNGYQKIITDTKEYYTEGGGDAFEVLWYRKTI